MRRRSEIVKPDLCRGGSDLLPVGDENLVGALGLLGSLPFLVAALLAQPPRPAALAPLPRRLARPTGRTYRNGLGRLIRPRPASPSRIFISNRIPCQPIEFAMISATTGPNQYAQRGPQL